jgi:hypothetical protein
MPQTVLLINDDCAKVKIVHDALLTALDGFFATSPNIPVLVPKAFCNMLEGVQTRDEILALQAQISFRSCKEILNRAEKPRCSTEWGFLA